MKVLFSILFLLIPTISFASDYIIRQKRVEFDNDYYLGVNGYYSVGDSLRKQSDDEIQLKILETLQRIEEKLDSRTSIPDDATPTEEPVTPETTDVPEVSDLNRKVFNIFKDNCATCHNDAKASKDLALVGEENGEQFLYDQPLSTRVLIHHVVNNVNLDKTGHKLMPVGGPPLANEDVETLRLWMVDKVTEESKKSLLENGE